VNLPVRTFTGMLFSLFCFPHVHLCEHVNIGRDCDRQRTSAFGIGRLGAWTAVDNKGAITCNDNSSCTLPYFALKMKYLRYGPGVCWRCRVRTTIPEHLRGPQWMRRWRLSKPASKWAVPEGITAAAQQIAAHSGLASRIGESGNGGFLGCTVQCPTTRTLCFCGSPLWLTAGFRLALLPSTLLPFFSPPACTDRRRHLLLSQLGAQVPA
jgi:hypothetical protein